MQGTARQPHLTVREHFHESGQLSALCTLTSLVIILLVVDRQWFRQLVSGKGKPYVYPNDQFESFESWSDVEIVIAYTAA